MRLQRTVYIELKGDTFTYATTQNGHPSGRERNLCEAPGIVMVEVKKKTM
jgi:hypothetical protein